MTSSVGGHSEACCSTPPVVVEGYDEQGKYEEIDGFKAYVTGPSDAKKGILVHMDVFGFSSQALQGADIMATLNTNQNYVVVMPDWFNGKPLSMDTIPMDTPDKMNNLLKFLEGNRPETVVARIPDYVKALQTKFPETKEWANVGFCWGGKVATLITSEEYKIFKAGVSAHPAMLAPDDAKSIKAPFCLLASKDEDGEAVKQFDAALTVPKHVETFPNAVHGWMVARADFNDPEAKSDYTRGYKVLIDFLGKNF